MSVSGDAADAKKTGDMIASVYNSTATYSVGDYVNYNGTIYRCTTAITTAEAWTTGHWTEVKVADEVTDLKSAFEHLQINGNEITTTWSQGYINSNNGEIGSDNTICYSALITSNGFEYTLSVASGYRLKIAEYQSNGTTFVGIVVPSKAGSATFIIESGHKFRIQILKADGTFPPSECTNTVYSLLQIVYTDGSLTLSGKAADAKITGEKIDELTDELNGIKYFPYGEKVTDIVVKEYINTTTGKSGSENSRARSGIVSTDGRKAIGISGNTYNLQVLAYDTNGSLATGDGYIGKVTDTWKSNEVVYIPDNIPNVALFFKRQDGVDFSNSDIGNIIDSLVIYSRTDTELKYAGVPADSKTVGENLNRGCFTVRDVQPLITTFSGVIALYDELVSNYPNYVSKNTLTSGGVTNYEYVFTNGNYNAQGGYFSPDEEMEKPTVLITAGTHGYEQSSVMGLYVLMKKMCEKDNSLSPIIYSANYRIIPIVTPWAYDNDSRVNENGVNINRNFASQDWVLTGIGEDYSGAEPGDQDETKIVQNWINAHNDAIILIDWHNNGVRLNQISCLLGQSADESLFIKKKYLFGMNSIIPYWIKEREIDETDIFAYTGETTTGGTMKSYAKDKGLNGFTCETSWNIKNTGKHSMFTIATNAESMGNTLLALRDLMKDF